jgi:hypothetical protein
MASVGYAVAAFIAIAAVSSVVFAEDPNNPDYGSVTIFGPPHSERSGPISTWPASWTDFCRLHATGTRTTDNEILTGPGHALPESLDQIYDSIVNSTSFKNASAGHGWVTIYWGLQEDGDAGYAVGQFLLLFGNLPEGVIQAFYNLDTMAVSVAIVTGTSCPAP